LKVTQANGCKFFSLLVSLSDCGKDAAHVIQVVLVKFCMML